MIYVNVCMMPCTWFFCLLVSFYMFYVPKLVHVHVKEKEPI